MLAVQCLIIFSEPFDAMGFEAVSEAVQLLFFAITFIVYVIVRGPIATTLAISAFGGLRARSRRTIKDFSNPWLCRPHHRLCYGLLCPRLCGARPGCRDGSSGVGAIALYLNIGLMFATFYGLVWYFIPNSFTNIPSGPHWQADGTIVYFSFVTLTSTGFGDVTPLHPIVRTLANLEAIIGQLFPATLLARLITLELRGYRQRS